MVQDSNMPTPFIIGFEGTELTSDLMSHLRKINPAGIILFKRNINSIKQVKKLISDIKELLGPVLVAVDHEGGLVSRFPDECAIPPSPSALNYAKSEELIREACKIQAELVAALGFNLNFAPVADLAVDPDNQVIGSRAYSDNAKAVADYGKICLEEHEALKIGTTAKHFPGHGRTAVDSHFATGAVHHNSMEEFSDDLEPFRQLIQWGVPSIMTAHLTYPIVDKEHPASLSPGLLRDVLRTQLKFSGLIISDCVEMAGLAQFDNPDAIVTNGLEAGVNLFISAYTIKKSKAFQLALVEAFWEYLKHHREPGYYSIDRLKPFRSKYVLDEDRLTKPPEIVRSIVLHRATLEKRQHQVMDTGFNRIAIVELSNSKPEGINLDSKQSHIASMIQSTCQAVDFCELNWQCDIKSMKTVVEQCNEKKMICVLLTSNGFNNENYTEFINVFNQATSRVHIAMADERDLKGNCPNEWLTRGYNSNTGRMLGIELMELIPK